MRLPTTVADQLAERILNQAASEGLLPPLTPFDWRRYHDFHDQVSACFSVPATSITPLMARVLYGISATAKPKRVLIVGAYAGNAMVWLTGPGFGLKTLYPGTKALGIDIDRDATELARANFSALGVDSRIELLCADALEVTPKLEGPWDLVFLDAEDPRTGKAIYLDLFQRYSPHLRPGGLLLAHDICVPKFTNDLAGYRDAVRDPAHFRRSAPLEIDPCGLELSVKCDTSATRVSTPTQRTIGPS